MVTGNKMYSENVRVFVFLWFFFFWLTSGRLYEEEYEGGGSVLFSMLSLRCLLLMQKEMSSRL